MANKEENGDEDFVVALMRAYEDDTLTVEDIMSSDANKHFGFSWDQIQRARANYRKDKGLPSLNRGRRPAKSPATIHNKEVYTVSEPQVIVLKFDDWQFAQLLTALRTHNR